MTIMMNESNNFVLISLRLYTNIENGSFYTVPSMFLQWFIGSPMSNVDPRLKKREMIIIHSIIHS